MGIIDSLIVELGYELTGEEKKKLDSFKNGTKSAVKDILKMGAVVAGVTVAIGAFVKTISESTDELGKNAKKIGVAVGELDALNFASEQATGSSQGLSDSLFNLNKLAQEASMGIGAGVEAFGRLGVEIGDGNGGIKDASTLFLEVSDSIGSLTSEAEKADLTSKLGLENFKLLLDQGKGGIQALMAEAKELGVTTPEDVKVAENFNDMLNRLKRTFKTLALTINKELAPVYTDLIELFKDLVPLMIGTIKGVFKLTDMFGGLSNVLKFLGLVIASIMAFKIGVVVQGLIVTVGALITAIKSLGTAAIIAQAKIMAIPIAIVSLLVIIGLMVDEIITTIRGGDSFFSRLTEKSDLFAKTMEALLAPIFAVKDAVSALIDLMQNPLSSDAWIKFAESILDIMLTLTGRILGALVAMVNKAISLMNKIPGVNIKTISNPVNESRKEKAKESFRNLFKKEDIANESPVGFHNNKSILWLKEIAEKAQGSTPSAVGTQATVASKELRTINNSSNSTNQKTVNQTVEIKIDGSNSNPQELAREIQKQISNQSETAMQNISNGAVM